MVTTSHDKSRISREVWRERPSFEDRSELRRAIDPTGWHGQARQTVAKARSASQTIGWRSTLGRVTVDASTLVTPLHSPVARHLVAVVANAMVPSVQIDWEDADSFERRTIERVRDLLKSLAFTAWNTFGYHFEVPHPAPADEASIDVFFEGAERNLLINIPSRGELVTYFGSDRSGTTFGGSLSGSNSHRDLMPLAAWIVEIR